MNKIENKIKEGLYQALKTIDESVEIDINDIIIEIPKSLDNGDYASNIALKYCKLFKDNPMNLGNKIKEVFLFEKYDIEDIMIAKPGFINIKVNKGVLASSILDIINLKDEYGQHPIKNDYQVNVEYVSANPTGDLHLGHARQASLGDSITRMYQKAGIKVQREYYLNDAGNQINNLCDSVIARYYQLFDLPKEIPADGYHGQDIKDIALLLKSLHQDKLLNDDSDETYQYIKKTALQFETDKLKNDLKSFRSEFDLFSSEQALYDNGKITDVLELLEQKEATFEFEDALWLNTTAFGDDKNRVLRKSDGSYTYLTPDIAYHLQKKNNGNDLLVNLWGADHHGYIKRMQVALEYLTGRSDILEVDIIQMVRLIKDGTEVKMSKRTGNAIGLKDLCDEVGIDAVRYFFASRAGSSHFDFDLDLAMSQSSENPVYYAQYAHARISSILSIAEDLKIGDDFNPELLNHQKEISLIKHLNEFVNLVYDAAIAREPHRITNYIQKLASLFHSYYNECKVINQDDLPQTKARLALLKASQITLRNSLDLVGVSAPTKM